MIALLSRLVCAVVLVVSAASAEVFESPPFHIEHVSSDRALAERSAEVLQGSLAELRDKLPHGDETIVVVILPDTADEFAGYAGPYAPGRVTGIAQSARGLIAVRAPYLAVEGAAEYEPTLRHELVHVLLARNGLTVNMPRWLNEGLAMTLGREHGWSGSIRVAQMYLEGQILTPRQMHVAFSNSMELEFGDAYAQSLSLTRYLRKRLGDEAFWSLITSLDEQTFSDGLREHDIDGIQALWAEWQRSLWLFAIVFSVISGFSLFQGAALLTIWSYIRRRRRGEAKMREWDREEAIEQGIPIDDEYVEEGPYEWESYYDDDDELR